MKRDNKYSSIISFWRPACRTGREGLRELKNVATKLILLVLPSAFFFISCQKQTQDPDALKKVVLRAYLYEGEPVDDIFISELLPFGGEDSVADPINDATVRLYHNNDIYQLTPNGGDTGYYHYEGNDLTIEEGETYFIEVDYFDKTAQAITTIPPPPTGVKLSEDTLYFTFNFDSIFSGGATNPESITVTWDNPEMDYYYISLINVENNPEPIYPFNLGEFIELLFLTKPTSESSYLIDGINYTHYGKHEVKVYRVNQEYVDLFTSIDQDSRTLNEPITNVVNGLGVFSGFNSVTREVYVLKD